MSNIPSSAKSVNQKNENVSLGKANPTMLQALQDLSTYFNVEINGKYTDPTGAMSGDAKTGTFLVKPN